MKYRRLNKEELESVEQDFIKFLAANSITGPDWKKLQSESPGICEQMIDIFSDVVLEKSLKKIEYLEFFSPSDIKTFHCQENEILLLGIQSEKDTGVDFTQVEMKDFPELFSNSPNKFSIYAARKKYVLERELEVFKMLESGALISKEGALYKLLKNLKPQQD